MLSNLYTYIKRKINRLQNWPVYCNKWIKTVSRAVIVLEKSALGEHMCHLITFIIQLNALDYTKLRG